MPKLYDNPFKHDLYDQVRAQKVEIIKRDRKILKLTDQLDKMRRGLRELSDDLE
jgi:hypothetical protein